MLVKANSWMELGRLKLNFTNLKINGLFKFKYFDSKNSNPRKPLKSKLHSTWVKFNFWNNFDTQMPKMYTKMVKKKKSHKNKL